MIYINANDINNYTITTRNSTWIRHLDKKFIIPSNTVVKIQKYIGYSIVEVKPTIGEHKACIFQVPVNDLVFTPKVGK